MAELVQKHSLPIDRVTAMAAGLLAVMTRPETDPEVAGIARHPESADREVLCSGKTSTMWAASTRNRTWRRAGYGPD